MTTSDLDTRHARMRAAIDELATTLSDDDAALAIDSIGLDAFELTVTLGPRRRRRLRFPARAAALHHRRDARARPAIDRLQHAPTLPPLGDANSDVFDGWLGMTSDETARLREHHVD